MIGSDTTSESLGSTPASLKRSLMFLLKALIQYRMHKELAKLYDVSMVARMFGCLRLSRCSAALMEWTTSTFGN